MLWATKQMMRRQCVCLWLVITLLWVNINISPLWWFLSLNLKILLMLHEPKWVSELRATRSNQDLRSNLALSRCQAVGLLYWHHTIIIITLVPNLIKRNLILQSANGVFTPGPPGDFLPQAHFHPARNSRQIFRRRVSAFDTKKEQQCFIILSQDYWRDIICVCMHLTQPV